MNRKETRLMEKLINALECARAYTEPHLSTKSEELRLAALVAIHDAIGPSEEWRRRAS